MLRADRKKIFIALLLFMLLCGLSTRSVFAQESPSVLYVPIIGLTSVPTPLALPDGSGNVTYNYAVKNFLSEIALNNVQVVDDTCSPVEFIEGDDDGDALLDYNETWRYRCTTNLSKTTQSIAIATGIANNITATHRAYATVVVGANTPPPLISIINITKVAYPFSLPAEGGKITFTYKVNNPGDVPLSKVSVIDDKCSAMSGKLGDRNGNNLLDSTEVWIYTCTTTLTETTTNTVNAKAFANGFEAVGDATITVLVDKSLARVIVPGFPNVGGTLNIKMIAWASLSGILVVLIIVFIVTRKSKVRKTRGKVK